MKKITLNIPDKRFHFFMELIKNLGFVQVDKSDGDSKEQIIENLKQGIKEVKLIREGKLKGRPAKELLDEL